MFKDKKKVLALLILVLTLSLVVLYRGSRVESIPTTRADNAKFVLASWDYPDEYGQGIDTITVYGNSTGSWVSVGNYEYNEASTLEWNESVGIKLKVWTWFNSTLTGAGSTAEGKLYQRHNVIVTSLGTTVFSQQNFTYSNVYTESAPMWYYVYDVVLNFLPVGGEIYTVTVDYEVFYQLAGLTNATMVFDGTDPYDTYTYSYSSGSQGIVGGEYVIDTDVSGGTQYFGYDEFSTISDLQSSVLFTPTAVTGTYRFCPIIYTYQKIDLQLTSHWAVAVVWSPEGIYLYHNTANHAAISSVQISTTLPIINHEYSVLLANYGTETMVTVYDNTASGLIYSGNTTTVNYDATSLYASIGQYSGGDGAMQGTWDDFTVVGFAFPEAWNTVSIAILMFVVSFHMWGYNVGLVILGLCMIPASTLYLAYGVKHDRSSDRLFYGLILFFMGCGLLIGGILP